MHEVLLAIDRWGCRNMVVMLTGLLAAHACGIGKHFKKTAGNVKRNAPLKQWRIFCGLVSYWQRFKHFGASNTGRGIVNDITEKFAAS